MQNVTQALAWQACKSLGKHKECAALVMMIRCQLV